MLEKAKTDSGEKAKNFFGGYTDDTLKAWDEVAKAYKKQNVRSEPAKIMPLMAPHNV